MSYQTALEKLKEIQQTHLLDFWDELDFFQQQQLLFDIHNLNIETFRQQQSLLQHPPVPSPLSIEPFLDYAKSSSIEDQERGRELISQNRMACLIVAGGQGTRLQLNGPKGLYPISVIRHKSLFQLFAEKILAAGKQVGRHLHAALMTSPLNHEMTVTYFNAHQNFTLKRNLLDFFQQKMLPFLDDQGNLFLESKESIAKGPNGNGSALHELYLQGVIAKWKEQGIQYVNFVLVDNPLADPFDAELLGFHVRNGNDITVKCILKSDPEEKVGVLVKQEEKVRVIEYSEMPEEARTARLSDGSLQYHCANVSLFCISISFIERLIEQKISLPLHLAYKSVTDLLHPNKKGWKFEHFIFDLLPLADKVQALLYPRDVCFAPLKNLTGTDSPSTVQEALQKRDKHIYEELFKRKAPEEPFELSQDFYYPTLLSIERWKNSPLPNDRYLE